MIIEQVVFKIQ